MKNITKYLKEELESKVLKNVKVVFDIPQNPFTLTAPNTYSESDIQIYLGDALYKELPAENDECKKLLGKNVENINDAYFEYSKFEHSDDDYEDEQINLKWDPYYDDKAPKEINMYKLSDFKYIILFDEFEIRENSDDYKYVLNSIFQKFDSSSINEYPITIKFNPKLLEFSE
jgi:hypothetical protein